VSFIIQGHQPANSGEGDGVVGREFGGVSQPIMNAAYPGAIAVSLDFSTSDRVITTDRDRVGDRVGSQAGCSLTIYHQPPRSHGRPSMPMPPSATATGSSFASSVSAAGSMAPPPGSGQSVESVVLGTVRLARRPVPNTPHWLLVEYDVPSGTIHRTGATHELRVYVDDPKKQGPPAITHSLTLHQLLNLNKSTSLNSSALSGPDSAYVGVGASTYHHHGNGGGVGGGGGGEIEGEEDGCRPSAVMVHDWSFTVKGVNTTGAGPSAHSAARRAGMASGTGGAGSGGDGGGGGGLSATSLDSVERVLEASSAWDELRVDYHVEWPLHLILTSEAMGVYNQLFGLLWSTRRTMAELDVVWPMLMETRYRRLPPQDNLWLRPLWSLHSQMMFLVKNLQIYLQVDVVEAQYAIMLKAIHAHQDFDAVRKAHTHYLAALTSKSHLGVRPLMEGLHRLLGLCRRFCAVFLNYSSASDIPHAEVTSISKSFRSDAAYLFLILERSDAKELAARLNFNGWFGDTAHAITGSSVGTG